MKKIFLSILTGLYACLAFAQTIHWALMLLLLCSCNDDEIDRLKDRVDEAEQRITSSEEITNLLSEAIDKGKYVPLFRIDQEGYWLWSQNNGKTFVPIIDQEENRKIAIGAEALDIRLVLLEDSSKYVLHLVPSSQPTLIDFSASTPYDFNETSPYSHIIFDDRHQQVSIVLKDGEKYQITNSVKTPASIAILSVAPIHLSMNAEASIEFRVNPSTAALHLIDGEDVLELDCVGTRTRSYVTHSENVKLTRIEQVYNPVTHELKEGQYRAVFSDCGHSVGYDDLYTLVLTCQKGTSQEYQISSSAFEIKSTSLEELSNGLPIVLINTPNDQPILSKQEWMEGASMTIVSANGQIEYQGSLSVKGRGNTSWGFPKKPYALKLDKKSEILGMKKHKRWCLLANWADRSLIRNAVAFELARQTELDWTPSGQHVELVLNGEHLGNYFLCEQIKVDENRVNISNPSEPIADRGYLMELDTYFDEAFKFRSPLRDLPWQFKDPDEVTDEQQAFMEQYVADMEHSLYDSLCFINRDFTEYMDLGSFADYWMVYEIAQLREPNHPKSVYMHKDAGGKMQAGPVWDFDLGCFKPRPYYYWADRDAVYYGQLFRDEGFRQLVRERWNNYRDHFLAVESMVDSLAEKLAPSEKLNFPMWPIDIDSNNDENLTDYTEVIARLKQGLREKILWMDTEIQSF